MSDDVVPVDRTLEMHGESLNGDDRRQDSIAELLRRLLDDVVMLVRSEFSLARSEMRESVANASGGAGALAAGGVVMLVALLCALGGIVAWLATHVGIVAAAFIVAAVTAAAGALLIVLGVNRLKKVEFAPKRAVANLKKDAEALKGDDRHGS